MSIATQKQNIPLLRFPEFSGEWVEKRLSKRVTKVGSGVTPRGGADVYESSGIPLLRSQNVRDNVLDLIDVAYISDEINAGMSSSIVHPNDVLLNITGASIGRSCVVPFNLGIANVNQHVCIIRLNEDNSPYFLQSFLASYKGQKLISQSQSGSGREGINFENIRAFITVFPALQEQQKIASFLSSVDKKIEQLSKKKKLLEQYKKGMMQKLFEQQIRFKDDNGNDYPDWKEKKVSDVFRITRGNVLAVSKMTSYPLSNSVYPVYSSQTKSNGLTGYFSEYLYENAITWTTDGANAGDVKYRAGKFYCTNVCGVLLSENGFANNCIAEMLNKVTEKYVSYVGNPKLMNNVMGQIKIDYPHPNEQTKIANFLSSLDDKINLIASELIHAQTFKKGLLQQMFV